MATTINASGVVFSDSTTMYTDMPAFLGSGSLSGTSQTFSGIPSDARIVWFILSAYSTGGTGLARISIPDASAGSYYSSYTNTSTTGVGSVVATGASNWVLNNSNASTYSWQYEFKFVKQDTSPRFLIMSGTGSTDVTGRQMWTGGMCTLSGTTFTSITLDNSAGNSQYGNWTILYA